MKTQVICPICGDEFYYGQRVKTWKLMTSHGYTKRQIASCRDYCWRCLNLKLVKERLVPAMAVAQSVVSMAGIPLIRRGREARNGQPVF